MRTVAVLGPIPRDRITTHRGEVFEKYGCALYTVAALSALMDPTDRICPIVHVRKQDEAAIKDLLAPMPNVDLTGVRSDTDRGDVVQLTYEDQNTRREHQTGFMSPILPSDVEFALDAEAFVCVPITDYEVGQATLEYIRANSDGVVLLDGHGPVSTLTIGGERQHRLWAERKISTSHVPGLPWPSRFHSDVKEAFDRIMAEYHGGVAALGHSRRLRIKEVRPA